MFYKQLPYGVQYTPCQLAGWRPVARIYADQTALWTARAGPVKQGAHMRRKGQWNNVEAQAATCLHLTDPGAR